MKRDAAIEPQETVQATADTSLLFVHEATPRPRDTSRSVTYSSVALKDLLQYYYTPQNPVCQYEEKIFPAFFEIFFKPSKNKALSH